MERPMTHLPIVCHLLITPMLYNQLYMNHQLIRYFNVCVYTAVFIIADVFQSSIVQLPLFSAPSILCTDTTVRVTIRQTLVTTQTVTVVSSVFILSSPGMSFIEESNQAGTVVDSYRNYFFPVLAIATIFLVIFLIFITSIILIGVWKKGRL